jgi:5-methylcytosine-specific restriction endonuclease McrA
MEKEEIIKFPKWKPNRINKMYFDIYKRFRKSCSGFIAKKEVREIILKKYNYKCAYCGSKDFLQIDHIKSVKFCFDNNMHSYVNKEENLQVLCRKCNASKLP